MKAVAAGILLLGSGALLMAHATTSPALKPVAASFTPAVAGKTFVPTCKAGAVTQTRAEPAWVNASFAKDGCVAPSLPGIVNGFTAKRSQIVAAMAAQKKYDAMADAYQRCIRGFVDARQAQAEKMKQQADVALLLIENHRITASRVAKQTVAERTDLAVNQFNEYGSACPD
jgi:hypothetical protein